MLYGVLHESVIPESPTVIVFVEGPDGGDCPLAIAPGSDIDGCFVYEERF
jgi:hypothetical protein